MDDKRKRVKPSIDQLIKFSGEHLYYEIAMLYGVGKLLASGIQGQILSNALLESFVMHARIVLDFLENKWQKYDDAIADDYLNSPKEYILLMLPKGKLLEDVHNRGHKEIVHLSYKRLEVEPKKKPWEFYKIMDEIGIRIKLFLDKADTRLIDSKLYEFR